MTTVEPIKVLLQVVLLSSMCFWFYGLVLRHVLVNVETVTGAALKFDYARRRSAAEVESLIRLGLGLLLQIVFCAGFVIATGTQSAVWRAMSFEPMLLVYGAFLGAAEAGLATFLGYAAVQFGLRIGAIKRPMNSESWIAMAKSGWVRLFSQAVSASPTMATCLTIVYIATEEVIFRAAIISYVDTWNASMILLISVALFAFVQVFHMPSWHSALFPVIGAVVVGIFHGALFLMVPTLVPLIVAHCVFFLIVML